MPRGQGAAWYLAVGLVAAAALSYQLLLMRLLAIVHWPVFAGMIISLALLGHGASGTALSLWRAAAQRHFAVLFAGNAWSFGFAAMACYAVAQRLPFNGLELVWDWRQWLWLAALYLVLALPFFFAANCFGLAFLHFRERIPAFYAADLLGAGIGAGAVMLLLWLWSPDTSLRVVAALAFLAALLAAAQPVPRRGALLFALAGLALALALPPAWLAPHVGEFKGLSRLLQVSGARLVEQRSSARGWLAVVESPAVPLRHAPGLSLLAQQEPPPQRAVFTDGDQLNVITRYGGDLARVAYLLQTTGALPYRLLAQPRVLVLNAGTGEAALQALAGGAAQVLAVEQNPQLLQLLQQESAGDAGGLLQHPAVRVLAAEARAFVRRTTARFDLIVLASADSFAGSAAGAQAAVDSYPYTVEAFGDYLQRLAPGGMLALTRWDKRPPRDSLKLFATALEALRRQGVGDPDRHLVMIRGWQTVTLLVLDAPLGEAQRAQLLGFCRELLFDPVHDPGLPAQAAERFHRAERADLEQGVGALLGDAAPAYFDAYKFQIRPATDDRPYFFHFFRWRALPELLRLREQGAAVLLDSGYLLLVASLAQALPLALLLILLPLARLPPVAGAARWRAATYFAGLGLGFLFVEVACLQVLSLHVGHALLAATLALGGFLVFAGLGSAYMQSRLQRPGGAPVLRIAAGVSLLCLAFQPLAGAIFAEWPQLALAARAGVALLLIAPLAGLMGMMFPIGLARLSRVAPADVPWAWGINGCASVVSPLLATLLGIHFGLGAVLAAAAVLYLGAGWVWR